MNATDGLADNLPVNGRSAIEVLTKAALTVTVALLTARNLSNLRQQPRKLAIYESLTAVIIPTYTIAEIATLAFRTVQIYRQRESVPSSRYDLSVALDQRAVAFPDEKKGDPSNEKGIVASPGVPSAEESIPLSVVSPKTPVPSSSSLNARSYLRLCALALLFAYFLATSLSYIRRATNNARTFLDDFTFLLSLSIQLNALLSILLTIHNTTWSVPESYIKKFKSLRSERDASDLFLSLAGRTSSPELQPALALTVSLQSISLLLMRQGGTGVESGALACENPFLKWYTPDVSWLERIWTTLSAICSLDVTYGDLHPTTRVPCHGHNASDWDFQFKAITDVAFGLAFIGAWVPLVMALRMALRPGFAVLKMRRARKFLGVMDAFSIFFRMGPWYVIIGLGMGVVTAWNLAAGDGGARWRWRDPWMGRLSIL